MQDFTVGQVVGLAFALIGRRPVGFTIAAAVLAFLPNLASPGSGTVTVRTSDAAHGVQVMSSTYSPLGPAGSIVPWLLSLVLYGIVVQFTLNDLREGRADFGAAVAGSLRALLPNIGIFILYYLAIAIGLILLIVPGVMLQCMWLVVIPASMAEGTGVFRAFGRARALTAGCRWPIFGLLLLYLVGMIAIFAIMFFGLKGSMGQSVDSGGVWAVKVVSSVLFAALSLVGSAGVTACYIELRRFEGRPLARDLAEAFA